MTEKNRIKEMVEAAAPWRLWGPCLSERQWGTVREYYSESGTAWDYFSHDQARSRAYRWGEDGIAGISDEKQLLNDSAKAVKEVMSVLDGMLESK